MSLLTEQVRDASEEDIILNDSTGYDVAVVGDWATVKSQSFFLNKKKGIYVKITVLAEAGVHGAGRVLLDGDPILSTGGMEPTETESRDVFLVLDSGSYTIAFQSAIWLTGGNDFSVDLCYIGAFMLSDVETLSEDSGSVQIQPSDSEELVEQTLVLPAPRKVPGGVVAEHTCFVVVYAQQIDLRYSSMKNIGEANTADYLNFRLYKNAVQVDWLVRDNDYTSSFANDTFGTGSVGLYKVQLQPGSTTIFRVDGYNGWPGVKNARVVIKVFACPWIIPSAVYTPIEFEEFSEGSTLYLVLEPFNDNPTKTVKIGKERFVSFGDATDYYQTSSGQNILSVSYKFELVKNMKVDVEIGGENGCISIIGVDLG